MKTIIAHGKYTVSFNTEIGDYEVGESSRDTTDFAGDYMFELAAEVIADDPSFPMVFERVEDDWVVGVFRDVEEDCVVAVMFEGSF
jgi:hypothetical protein